MLACDVVLALLFKADEEDFFKEDEEGLEVGMLEEEEDRDGVDLTRDL